MTGLEPSGLGVTGQDVLTPMGNSFGMTPKIRATSHIMESVVLHPQSQRTAILLMEEILHHLGCIKPCKQWEKLRLNWCRISSINRIDLLTTTLPDTNRSNSSHLKMDWLEEDPFLFLPGRTWQVRLGYSFLGSNHLFGKLNPLR